jgi:hypothetical protein
MSGFHDWNKVSGIQAEEWNVQRDGTGVQDKLSACLPVFLLRLVSSLLEYSLPPILVQSIVLRRLIF